MKVRVKRDGLLGLTLHRRGEELDIERDQWRVWLEPLDDESKAVAEEWQLTQKQAKVDKAKLDLMKMQQRIIELEAQTPPKAGSRVKGDVL